TVTPSREATPTTRRYWVRLERALGTSPTGCGLPSTLPEGSPCLLQPWALPHRATLPPPWSAALARRHGPGCTRPPPLPGAARVRHAGGAGTPHGRRPVLSRPLCTQPGRDGGPSPAGP